MNDFVQAWDRLSEMGVCDQRNGAQFGRVSAEWVGQGFPTPVDEFIARRANVTADGNEPSSDAILRMLRGW